MCGIVGWADFQRDLSGSRPVIQAMTDTMCCRGPDAEGLWLSRQAALGHRRLAVIDPSGSAQPMTVEVNGRTAAVLTFCGELYNFVELRHELMGYGHRFRTRGDTEVVLRAYLQWGADMVTRFNGMFALGIWDERNGELLLVRDRMGVKPLYYYPTPGGVLFGSEPKAILANPLASARVSVDGMCEVLDMVKTPEHAVYSGMLEVRPGYLIRIRHTGVIRQRYWALEAYRHDDDLRSTVVHVRDLLEDTVDRQLVADVPVGTLLSGGLDSSAVTALAAGILRRAGTGPVLSFAVDFVGADEHFAPDAVRGDSDTPFARELAQHVGADHTEILLDNEQLTDPAVRGLVLGATDLPPSFWGDMWPSLYLFFRAIRDRCTVALSGESADEQFGGYRWFHNPGAVQAPTFPWLTSGSARYFGGLSLLDRGLIEKLDIPGYRAMRYHEALAEVPVLPGESAEERRMREVSYLNLTRFVQTLLDRKDRMSMAVGLEVRVPFCDHRLVSYVFNAPWSMKSVNGGAKSLLRAAVEDLLPRAVLDRVKTPYPATLDPRYEGALRTKLAHVVADGDAPVLALLDRERVRRLLNRPLRSSSRPYDRGGLEMVLWLNDWITRYGVVFDF